MAARLQDQFIEQNECPILSWSPPLHGPHLLVGLGEGQPHALVSRAAVPRRASLAAEARAGVDAADAGEAGMGVALGEEEPRRVRGCTRWAPSRAEPQDLLGLILENSGTINQHLGTAVPCGAEAIVPGVLMGPGERPDGLFPGADELDVQGRGKELRGRASPAEGGSGRRGVRVWRWKRRPGGGLAVVLGPLGLVSLGGEGSRWGGPLSGVGECSGRASLATEGFGGTGVTDGEGTGRCEGPLPARSSGRALPEVKGSSG